MISADRVRAILAEIRKLPYIALYPGDWMKDTVAGVSLSAQMLWMRMMFIMHDAPLYGHLVDAHFRPLPEARLVRLCGARSVAEYRKLLAELHSAGVPSETGDPLYDEMFAAEINGESVDLSPMRTMDSGVIYSRRMVRDQRLRVVRRLVGGLGGPKRGSLVDQTQKGLVDQTPSHARVIARAEDETALGSTKQLTKSSEGVQGEGLPDFGAAQRIHEKLRQSALKETPPEQMAVVWEREYGEALIYETLADCESEYKGKHWRYLERILTSRRDDPSQRPGNRMKRGNGGRANGSGGDRRGTDSGSAGEVKEPARNPLGNFGMRHADDVIRELAAKRKLQEVPKPVE